MILIRDARDQDVPGIAKINNQYLCNKQTNEKDLGEMIRTQSGQGHRCIVAELNDELVGFSCFGTSRDVDLTGCHIAELWALYIDSSHLRRGCGSALLATVCRVLSENDIQLIYTWIPSDSIESSEWFEKRQWERQEYKKLTSDTRTSILFSKECVEP